MERRHPCRQPVDQGPGRWGQKLRRRSWNCSGHARWLAGLVGRKGL